MGAVQGDARRHVLPRWLSFGGTTRARELNSVGQRDERITPGEGVIEAGVAAWKQDRKIGLAADVVGAARVLDRMGEVEDAKRFLLRQGGDISPFILEVADLDRRVRRSEARDDSREERKRLIRELRRQLRTAPWDPIRWTELARLHLMFGQERKAIVCMESALATGGEARFVIRAAVRLWTHLRDPERAQHVAGSARRTREDPWLLAAEVACATMMRRRSRLLKVGHALVGDDGLSHVSRSELAAALGTVALGDGRARRAKRLFEVAMADPTENAVAQVVWLTKAGSPTVREDRRLVEAMARGEAPEAAARHRYHKGELRGVLEECERWRTWEPFSTGPAVWGSFVASVGLDDDSAARKFAKVGLTANPKDFALLNNLAFAQIGLGEYREAGATLRKCQGNARNDRDRAVLTATKGLLKMSQGDIKMGRMLYDLARRTAEENGKAALADEVVIYRARAEGKLGEMADRSAIGEAIRVARAMSGPMATVYRRKIREAAEQVGMSA